MISERRTAIAVIGGGFAGLSAAIECAKRGLSVTILERNTIGCGASGKNAGHLCHGFVPTDQEMVKSLGADLTAALWPLSQEGIAIVQKRDAEYREHYGIDCGLRMGYMIAARTARQLPKIRRHYRHLQQRYGYARAAEVSAIDMPLHSKSKAYHGGYYDEGMGQIEPLPYINGLRREAENLQVSIIEHAEVKAIHSSDSCRVLYKHDGTEHELVSGHVICGGADPAALIPAARRKIIILETYVGKTQPIDSDLCTTIFPKAWTMADYSNLLTYFRRTADGCIIIGSGDCVPNTSAHLVEKRLHHVLRRIFPDLPNLQFSEIQKGRLDFTARRLPHLARYNDRIYVAQGCSGIGLGMTAIMGRVMAEAIAGDDKRFNHFAAIPHRNIPQQKTMQTISARLALLYYRAMDFVDDIPLLRKA